jgi:hypothetical protein
VKDDQQPPKDDESPVPKLGRGRFWFRITPVQLFRILSLIVGLVAILAFREGCGKNAANFIHFYDSPQPKDPGVDLVPAPPLSPEDLRDIAADQAQDDDDAGPPQR